MTLTKEQAALNKRKRREEHRKEILEILSNGKEIACISCSNDDPRCLQIDHVNGHGGHNGKHGDYYFGILKDLRSGSKDYQILCANCNWIKRHENNENNQRKYILGGTNK